MSSLVTHRKQNMALNVIVSVLLLGACLVQAQPPPICYRAQMPNEADEYSFYKCDASGQAHLWRCAPGTIYDRVLEICNWEDTVRGRNDGAAVQNATTNGNSTRAGGANNGGWAENNGYGYGNVNRFANEYPLEGPGALGEERPDWEGGEPWEIPRHRLREMQEQQQRQEMARITQQRQFQQTQFQLQAQAPPSSPPQQQQQQQQQQQTAPTWRNTGITSGMICLASDIQPRMYMNPGDCSTFFTCNMGRPVLTYCLRGQYFNPERRGCDDAIHPGCNVVASTVEVLGVTEVEGGGVPVAATATTATTPEAEGAGTSRGSGRRSSRRRNRVRTEAIILGELDAEADVNEGEEKIAMAPSDPLAVLPGDIQVEVGSSKENEIPTNE